MFNISTSNFDTFCEYKIDFNEIMIDLYYFTIILHIILAIQVSDIIFSHNMSKFLYIESLCRNN